MMAVKVPAFVKWAGGKKQLLGQFEQYFPGKFKGYLEPFVGSGAVFFHIRKLDGKRRYFLSDNNLDLINTYLAVRDKVDELIALLKVHKKKHSKDYFYEVRKEFNSETVGVERAAQMIYLNKTCFNGLYRVNSKGGFNVPIGQYKNPPILIEDNLREASKLLQGVKIECMSFEKIVPVAKKGDFVYMDPPYQPLSKTSNFTSYTKASFGEKDQEKLSKVYKKLDKKGCHVMLSNSEHPLIRNLYKEFDIRIVKAKRAISCVGTGRGAIDELVILNYKPPTKPKQSKLK